jgi:hypothetical protein
MQLAVADIRLSGASFQSKFSAKTLRLFPFWRYWERPISITSVEIFLENTFPIVVKQFSIRDLTNRSHLLFAYPASEPSIELFVKEYSTAQAT